MQCSDRRDSSKETSRNKSADGGKDKITNGENVSNHIQHPNRLHMIILFLKRSSVSDIIKRKKYIEMKYKMNTRSDYSSRSVVLSFSQSLYPFHWVFVLAFVHSAFVTVKQSDAVIR